MINERLVAHRGYQKKYPENTLLAMTKAIESGAHFIEMDIQFTQDEQPVIYHDISMQRVSKRADSINQVTLNKALNCPAYEPKRLGDQFIQETIAPLSAIVDLLANNPTVAAFIELKSEAIEQLGIEKTYEVIENILEPIAGQCIIISFHFEFIAYAKKQAHFKTGLVAKTWKEVISENYEALQLDYVFCNKHAIPAKADLDNLPFYLVIYEVDNAEQAMEWFDRGADLVETFDIAGVLKDLGRQAL